MSSSDPETKLDLLLRDMLRHERERSHDGRDPSTPVDVEELFGQIAVELKIITPEQLGECLQEVERLEDAGQTEDLRHILLRKSWITKEGLQRVLQEQQKRMAANPQFSRYEVRKRLGEGATANVYSGWDRELGRPVALKVLREEVALSEILRQRFRREATTSAVLSHPNLIKLHDAGEENGKLYLVMELVEGRPLNELIKEGRHKQEELVRILQKAASGVAHAHSKGVVHRDLKPSNIVVTSGQEPKVGDFGLAHLVDASTQLTRTGAVLGTPLYMAPEQVGARNDEISPRTDVYALGAILYEIVTGRTPYLGETSAEIYGKILHEDLISPRSRNPQLSPKLEAIILKALEKEPQRRYASAVEFADDLARQIADQPIVARAPSLVSRLLIKMARHPRLVGLGAAIFALLIAGSWIWLEQRARAYEDADHNGSGAWEMQDYGGAIEQFQKAARIRSNRARPWVMIGRCEAAIGHEEEALHAWSEALKREPKDSPALFEHGKALLIRHLKSTLSSRVGGRPGSIWLQDDWGRPEQAFQELSDVTSLLEKRNAERALAFIDHRYAEAAKSLADYAQSNPWDHEALGFVGLAHYYARDLPAAERWLSESPDPFWRKLRGDVRYLQRKYEAAYEDYVQVGVSEVELALLFEIPIRGCRMWLRNSAGRLGISEVVIWNDQSGNGNSAFQGTALVPQINDMKSPKPAIKFDFDAYDRYFLLPHGFNEFNGLSLFVVARPNQPRSHAGFLELGNVSKAENPEKTLRTDTIFFGIGDSSSMLAYRVAVNESVKESVASDTVVPEQVQVFSVMARPDGEVTLYKNGGVAGKGFTNPPRSVKRMSNFIGMSDGVAYRGDLFEIILYDRILSEPERQAVERHLREAHFAEPAKPPVSLGPVGSGSGLLGEYFHGREFNKLALKRVDKDVNSLWTVKSPDPSMERTDFSVRWRGQIVSRTTETYTFSTRSDDGVRLWVDGRLIINNWTGHGPTEDSGSIALAAGKKYDIMLEYYQALDSAEMRLRWSRPSHPEMEIIPTTQLYPAPQ